MSLIHLNTNVKLFLSMFVFLFVGYLFKPDGHVSLFSIFSVAVCFDCICGITMSFTVGLNVSQLTIFYLGCYTKLGPFNLNLFNAFAFPASLLVRSLKPDMLFSEFHSIHGSIFLTMPQVNFIHVPT